MKKLFGMIAIVLLFSSVVFAGTKKLSETKSLGRNYFRSAIGPAIELEC